MSKTMVRIYDSKTKKVSEIPAEELAPGYIKVKIEGHENPVFVRADELPAPPPASSEPPQDMRELMESLEETFREFRPLTIAQWWSGFTNERDPEGEIAMWLTMGAHYRFHTQKRELSREARNDYYKIILNYSISGEHARHVVQLKELSRNEMKRVIKLLMNGLPQES